MPKHNTVKVFNFDGTRIRGFSISKIKKYFSIFDIIDVPGTDQCSWFLDAPDSPHSSQ